MKEMLSILEQSLQKKLLLLDEILKKSKEQATLLRDEDLAPEDFEKSVEDKGALIEKLEGLDSGFEQVYGRIRDELPKQKAQYKEEIERLKKLISEITARSTSIQAEEARNKELAQKKFATVRKQIKEAKTSRQVVNQYYQNMMKLNLVDPQFMDDKQ